MVETDWREILSFSQKELNQADKEKLCESLSWMEADDIELNFSDLKALFRLSQDMLKYKNEQVNNLLGQVDTMQRKTKNKSTRTETSSRSSNSPLETVAHQKEVIKYNKNILEQLSAEIAELEERKSKLEDKNHGERDSESSRATLSEINDLMQLENEITVKNKHIRKLLSDVKVLEEENSKLKEKISVLKNKLSEATKLIENFTEQLLGINNECTHLKEILGKSEQSKSQLMFEVEALRKELREKESNKDNTYEEIKSKIQHWKHVARSKKSEIDALVIENEKLKETVAQLTKQVSPKTKKDISTEETATKIKDLQDKLLEASKEIEQSASLINVLREENKKLKDSLEEMTEHSVVNVKNESDDGKEQTLINKLKRKVRNLSISLQGAEEMISVREKELAEISSELQLLQSSDGVKTLIEGLKSKKQQLRIKDEGIKSMVQEINALSQEVNELQLQNETLRRKYNVAPSETISSTGILKHYHDIEQQNMIMREEIKKYENKLIHLEMKNRSLNAKLSKLTKVNEKNMTDKIFSSKENFENMPMDGGGEGSVIHKNQNANDVNTKDMNQHEDKELKSMIIENECLRKGLQEILDFLKDNSTTTSGILSLQCPSLETVLRSMEARHTAGWYAPHMTTVMELREALGGKNALLEALHESRKETYQLMTQLSNESKKSSVLEKQLHDIETENYKNAEEQNKTINEVTSPDLFEESGMSEKEINCIDFTDQNQIENIITKSDILYDNQLKRSLEHFHDKFKKLYEKMTSIFVVSVDNQNQWSIKEEQYKAEIQNLKTQLQQDDDVSEVSPGIVPFPNINILERKCKYLEESYKYIRTQNENIKNENFESKKELMVTTFEYETQIQKFILSITNLTNKLRNSISLDLFWKQNKALNEVVLKYRKVLENVNNKSNTTDLVKYLENDKIEIISRFQKQLHDNDNLSNDEKQKFVFELQDSIVQTQLNRVISELETSENKIIKLEESYKELQKLQGNIIDDTVAAMTKKDFDLVKRQLKDITEENKILREQCQHVESQLDIALLQLQEHQQQQHNNDMELNILRHQILDLQSTGNNKAILARLSSEVLVTHLQVSEGLKKIESLTSDLNKEKERRIKAEELLKSNQKVFDVSVFRYETKFKYLFEVMQVLRQQYQGCLPLSSIENYIDKREDLSRKTHAVDQTLSDIEDLQSSLIIKHTVFDQILDVSKNKCLIDEDSCPHKIKYIVLQSTHARQLDHLTQKLQSSEQARDELIKQCNNLEKSLLLLNQSFGKTTLNMNIKIDAKEINESNIEVEDVSTDDESSSRKNGTITLTKPLLLKPNPCSEIINNTLQEKKTNLPNNAQDNFVKKHSPQDPSNVETKVANVLTQTTPLKVDTSNKHVQTDEDKAVNELKIYSNSLKIDNDKKVKELREAMTLARIRTEENLKLNSEKIGLESDIQTLQQSNIERDHSNEKLRITIEELRKQINDLKSTQFAEQSMVRDVMNEENKSLLLALKQLENDKNILAAEYKELLNKEREEYSKNVKTLQEKILELQTEIDKGGDNKSINDDTIKESFKKYTMNITDLKNKCFRLQSELDECKNEVSVFQSECDRWKDLASERLHKMEQLNSQLEERHSHEVEAYKAENQHWLSQLNETQKEHMELRSRLTEQKTLYLKQLAEKDAHIEQLRSIINSLKAQILNMQTMLSVNDPSFDLTAIVEVEESTDAMSQHGFDKLEIKFDSATDLNEFQGDIVTLPGSSSTIWQETIIDRLRRDKQLAAKQNTILRRQIKALAARERRSRLDAQNLKNQIFRISTSGSKVATGESAAMQSKIASLQAQLTSARRDTQSNVALWDKWKRAQQASERWQARYEEKCQEVQKLEASTTLAKSAVVRLEREKRVLLSRISEIKDDSQLAIEKQDAEPLEKSHRSMTDTNLSARDTSTPTISTHALLERIQAQQRRIVALELAERGNEHLVSEYEKSLAEITSLKGQVLKLESTLLESQLKTPLKTTVSDSQPELEYWKSYCEMLKEENVQLTMKINALDSAPTTAHQHRVNDLEQTVLTLRGLVSKLQADQKTVNVYKKADSRPSSGRSNTEKTRSQLESYRIEIANLKRSILDKDLLLEKSKEMLKIAAEREDELLRENSLLRRRLEDLTKSREGFLSA
ncbi:centrosomal protein of 290 kDa isoform X2 [Manduca sexta]|uniref:centrosomal protein of 290 kDa isoform X2 n=1 Tax=Manduca sexta TaxID=7130 RepID=UPI00188DDA05|nr:centrosomal protein of 290 kDa isoform X2 [Manduca sexta]